MTIIVNFVFCIWFVTFLLHFCAVSSFFDLSPLHMDHLLQQEVHSSSQLSCKTWRAPTQPTNLLWAVSSRSWQRLLAALGPQHWDQPPVFSETPWATTHWVKHIGGVKVLCACVNLPFPKWTASLLMNYSGSFTMNLFGCDSVFVEWKPWLNLWSESLLWFFCGMNLPLFWVKG